MKVIGSDAQKRNPLLEPFERLIGEWRTTGAHPLLPGKTFHGRTSFSWIEGGAFVMMRSEMDEPEIPSGIAIFGSDDADGSIAMLYFDERVVSRKYAVAVDDEAITWSRDDPKLRQRMTLTVDADGKTLVGKGEMSRDGKPWEGDLELTCERV